jgi:hypothetical protein
MKKSAFIKSSIASILIMLGTGWLLVRFDILSSSEAHRAWKMWPVLFIIWGFDLLWRARDKVMPVLITPLLIAGCVLAAWFVPSEEHHEYHDSGLLSKGTKKSAPLNKEIALTEIEISAGALDLRISPDPGDKVEIKYSGIEPVIVQDNSRISISSDSHLEWTGCGRGFEKKLRWEAGIPAVFPVSIKINSGASDISADLSGLQLKNFSLSAGASDIDLSLPSVKGELTVYFKTGASDIDVTVPSDAGVKLITKTALSDIDTHGLNLNKNGSVYSSPNYDLASSRININLEGAVSDFSLGTKEK